jgi:hypothetical protein
MATKQDAVWTTIDPASLPQEAKALYDAYKTQYRVMKEAREAFENYVGKGVPKGQRMVFGYNFGKLSVALVVDDRKPKQAAPKQTLAEFLAAQRDAGRGA